MSISSSNSNNEPKPCSAPVIGCPPIMTLLSIIVPLLILISLANQPMVMADGGNQDQTHNHLEGSPEFQTINSYLTALDPLSSDPAYVVEALKEAVDIVEIVQSIGLDNFYSSPASSRPAGAHLKACVDNLLSCEQPHLTLHIMHNLIRASKSCNQEATSFLMLVVQHQTFKGQFLNKYARQLLDNCFRFNVDHLGGLMARAVGKMDSHLYEMINRIADQVLSARLKVKQRAKGEIYISDPQPTPGEPKDRVRSLKQLTLTPDGAQLQVFAKAFANYYNELHATDERAEGKIPAGNRAERLAEIRKFYSEELVKPCRKAVNRLLEPLNILPGEENHEGIKTSELLESKRETDKDLDYLLEISRICSHIDGKEKIIWGAVKNAFQ